jgi:sulfite reductase (NADPH) hemoprotein beta-component
MGIEAFRAKVDEAFQRLRAVFNGQDLAVLGDIQRNFAPPQYVERSQDDYFDALDGDFDFREWVERNVSPHKHPSYASVTISLKGHGDTPGDATSDQMRAIADLAERFAHDELRISHEQNIVLPHVAQADLPAIYRILKSIGLATANIGLISDIIACPGMDYCALATARSIPIAQDIALRYASREAEIGHMQIKISGCINACGHHHVGHVGILGLDKAGVENYQITLGGSAGNDVAIGEKMGRGFNVDELMPALDRLIDAYLALRLHEREIFAETLKRLGTVPFQEALYVVDQAA